MSAVSVHLTDNPALQLPLGTTTTNTLANWLKLSLHVRLVTRYRLTQHMWLFSNAVTSVFDWLAYMACTVCFLLTLCRCRYYFCWSRSFAFLSIFIHLERLSMPVFMANWLLQETEETVLGVHLCLQSRTVFPVCTPNVQERQQLDRAASD